MKLSTGPARALLSGVTLAFAGLLLVPVGVLAAPSVTEFSAGTAPVDAVAGPDGNVWFAEAGANKIAKVTPAGAVTQYSSGLSSTAGLAGIAAGPDGNLWFTESSNDKIGRITTSGAITEFSVGITAGSGPLGITAGPDGNLWFTEMSGNRIGRITPSGTVTEFSAGISAGRNPDEISAGPDGNLWFTEHTSAGAIGRITTGGTVTEFGGLTFGLPTGIAAGPDGNIWFTENANPGAIGRMTSAGALTEFTGGATPLAQPADIIAGDDGNLYFTEYHNPGKLGQITPTGTITYFAGVGLTTNSGPWSVAAGGDGNIWFTENAGNRVAVRTIGPGVATTAPTTIGPNGATATATVRPNVQATTYSFDWGLTTAYGTSTSPVSAGSGTAAQPVTAALSGLIPATTYHYRIEATNASGTTIGADQSFTTLVLAPAVVTGAVSGVAQTAATLNATVNPNAASTSYHFEFGTSPSYGTSLPVSDAAVGADSAVHAVTQIVGGLQPGTLYHYRVVATNSTGVSYGSDVTFTTLASVLPPAALIPVLDAGPSLPPATGPVLGRSATVATVSGTVMVVLPGSTVALPLNAASTVPVGTTIDATTGMLRLTNIRDPSGKLQTATFWGGSFKVGQPHSKNPLTVITLTEPSCGKSRMLSSLDSNAPPTRHLWAHDNHGRFVTRGRTAVATVRGTVWYTRETCAGTLVKVTQGTVSVRDLVRHRTVLVSSGHSYLARR